MYEKSLREKKSKLKPAFKSLQFEIKNRIFLLEGDELYAF